MRDWWLIIIDDNLSIRVAKSEITESILPGCSHFKFSDLHGRRLSFAPKAILRPDPAHLAWHRREVFGLAYRCPFQWASIVQNGCPLDISLSSPTVRL